MMSCVVAPLWNDRSSSAGSRACTAWTNGIVGTPATPARTPIAAMSRSSGRIASIAGASAAGARPNWLSLRARAASTASMLPTHAVSEKQARIASVANNGPSSSESSGRSCIVPPYRICRWKDCQASTASSARPCAEQKSVTAFESSSGFIISIRSSPLCAILPVCWCRSRRIRGRQGSSRTACRCRPGQCSPFPCAARSRGVNSSFITTSPTNVVGAILVMSTGSGSPDFMPSGVAFTTMS